MQPLFRKLHLSKKAKTKKRFGRGLHGTGISGRLQEKQS